MMRIRRAMTEFLELLFVAAFLITVSGKPPHYCTKGCAIRRAGLAGGRGMLSLRGGRAWEIEEEIVLQDVSNLTEESLEYPKVTLNRGFIAAVDLFAGVPLCPESMYVFRKQVGIRELLLFLSMPIDKLEAEYHHYRRPAMTCLSKFCKAHWGTGHLRQDLQESGIDIDFLLPPIRLALSENHASPKVQALKTLACLRDEEGATFLKEHQLVLDISRCLADSAEVATEAIETLLAIVRTQTGLGEVFSGHSLECLEAILSSESEVAVFHVLDFLLPLASVSVEAQQCVTVFRVPNILMRYIRSNDQVVALTALEHASMLNTTSFDNEFAGTVLVDAIACWQLQQEDPSSSLLHSDLLHERRLAFVCRQWREAPSAADIALPQKALLERLCEHLVDLAGRKEAAPQTLALSAATTLCNTSRGCGLLAEQESFPVILGAAAAALRSTDANLFMAALNLFRGLVLWLPFGEDAAQPAAGKPRGEALPLQSSLMCDKIASGDGHNGGGDVVLERGQDDSAAESAAAVGGSRGHGDRRFTEAMDAGDAAAALKPEAQRTETPAPAEAAAPAEEAAAGERLQTAGELVHRAAVRAFRRVSVLSRVPFPEQRVAALALVEAMAAHGWGLRALMEEKELLEALVAPPPRGFLPEAVVRAYEAGRDVLRAALASPALPAAEAAAGGAVGELLTRARAALGWPAGAAGAGQEGEEMLPPRPRPRPVAVPRVATMYATE